MGGLPPHPSIAFAAFNHDFTNLKEHSGQDRKVIETLGATLADLRNMDYGLV